MDTTSLLFLEFQIFTCIFTILVSVSHIAGKASDFLGLMKNSKFPLASITSIEISGLEILVMYASK